MKHKVSELEGALLDAAVAKAEGDRLPDYWLDPDTGTPWLRPGREEWSPSKRWDQGGPIIERERVCVAPSDYSEKWQAFVNSNEDRRGYSNHDGPTPLVSAMRLLVTIKFGDEVELP